MTAAERKIVEELVECLCDATQRLGDFIGSGCECDNTHRENHTQCCLCQYGNAAIVGKKLLKEGSL